MKHLFHATASTLMEVILAVSLFAMIAAIPFTLDSGITYRIQAESAQSQIAHSFRRAQLYAQQGKNDSAWGVYIQHSSITVFAGSTYATRNSVYDDVISYDSSKISLNITSGANQVLFAKTTGIPSAASSITVTSTSADSKSIAFTIDGKLTYN